MVSVCLPPCHVYLIMPTTMHGSQSEPPPPHLYRLTIVHILAHSHSSYYRYQSVITPTLLRCIAYHLKHVPVSYHADDYARLAKRATPSPSIQVDRHAHTGTQSQLILPLSVSHQAYTAALHRLSLEACAMDRGA